MIRVAFHTLRNRRSGFIGAFVALLFAATIITACGILIDSGARSTIPTERYSGTDLVVTGKRSVETGEESAPLPASGQPRLSADAAVWIPDLYSAVKERQAGGMINLALAHQRAHRCSLPVAVMLAIRQINRTIDEFVGLFEEIRPRLSPSAVGYAEGMAGWIRGCCHWSRTVPRYADTAAAPA